MATAICVTDGSGLNRFGGFGRVLLVCNMAPSSLFMVSDGLDSKQALQQAGTGNFVLFATDIPGRWLLAAGPLPLQSDARQSDFTLGSDVVHDALGTKGKCT